MGGLQLLLTDGIVKLLRITEFVHTHHHAVGLVPFYCLNQAGTPGFILLIEEGITFEIHQSICKFFHYRSRGAGFRAELTALMGQIIAWSIADETLHTESMTKIFREYVKENPEVWTDDLKRKIYEIAETMVTLEDRFIELAFGVTDMKRLTKDEVRAYIRYIADRRLAGLGLKAIFGSGDNPLPWVDAMLGVSHTNFFENRVVDYAKGALTGDWADVWGQAK